MKRTQRTVCGILTTVLACALCLIASQAGAFDKNAFTDNYLRQLEERKTTGNVIFKLDRDAGLFMAETSVASETLDRESRLKAARVQALLVDVHPSAQVGRFFSRSVDELRADRARAQSRGHAFTPDLSTYGLITFSNKNMDNDTLIEIVRALNSDPRIECAYPQPVYELAVLSEEEARSRPSMFESPAFGDRDPDTPDFESYQLYRGSPENWGINADEVETWPGARGQGLKVIDMEGAWLWDHEDMPTPFLEPTPYGGPHGGDPDFEILLERHGTAVVGIMGAKDNGYGMKGMIPDAQFASVESDAAWSYYPWATIVDEMNIVMENLDPGDIYLLELHCPPEYGGNDYMPMEYFPLNFDVIQIASQLGIICVEAAGNGFSNLDDYLTWFVRNDPVNDCLAIMVGAMEPDGTVASFSNYGERVDVCGWGHDVATLYQYGDLFGRDEGYDHERWYTLRFSGTSSATPIAASAVGAVQGLHRAEYSGSLTPMEMREHLSANGTPHLPNTRQVGPLPDIAKTWRAISDDGAPEAIDDLATIETTSNRVRLYWHAPADDFHGYPVDSYDIRYSTSPITEANWQYALQAPYEGEVWGPGCMQAQYVYDLMPSTTYYFAIKSADPNGNVSPISNGVSETTEPPAPELTFDPDSMVEFGLVYANDTHGEELRLLNTGSADLVISSLDITPYTAVTFQMDATTPLTIPAGGEMLLQIGATPLEAGSQFGLLAVASNADPEIQNAYLIVEGVEIVTDPLDPTFPVCAGGQVDSPFGIVNQGNASVEVSAWITDDPASVSHLSGSGSPYLSLSGIDFLVDLGHGQSIPIMSTVWNMLSDNGASLHDTHEEISAATLADRDILYVWGGSEDWSQDELDALNIWINAGGSLILDITAFSMEAMASFNTISGALGAGFEISLNLEDPYVGPTSNLADHRINWGVNELDLANSYLGLSTQDPAMALVSTPDGSLEKVAVAQIGTGRILVSTENYFVGTIVDEGTRGFSTNSIFWLAARIPWLSLAEGSASIEGGATFMETALVDATSMPVGIHDAYYVVALNDANNTQVPFSLTVDVRTSTLSIDDLHILPYECVDTEVVWSSSEAATCELWWADHGQALTLLGTTPLGTEHVFGVTTEFGGHYDYMIVANSPTCGLPAELSGSCKIKHCLGIAQGDMIPDDQLRTRLIGSFPNPFNPATEIKFSLAEASDLSIRIYNIQGQLVKILAEGHCAAGEHAVTWHGRNEKKERASSGIYFVRLQAGEVNHVSKLTLLK